MDQGGQERAEVDAAIVPGVPGQRCGSSCTPWPTTWPTSCAPGPAGGGRALALTTLREKLVKIGARIVRHGRESVFQLAEVAVPRALFAEIMRRIGRLRPEPLAA